MNQALQVLPADPRLDGDGSQRHVLAKQALDMQLRRNRAGSVGPDTESGDFRTRPCIRCWPPGSRRNGTRGCRLSWCHAEPVSVPLLWRRKTLAPSPATSPFAASVERPVAGIKPLNPQVQGVGTTVERFIIRHAVLSPMPTPSVMACCSQPIQMRASIIIRSASASRPFRLASGSNLTPSRRFSRSGSIVCWLRSSSFWMWLRDVRARWAIAALGMSWSTRPCTCRRTRSASTFSGGTRAMLFTSSRGSNLRFCYLLVACYL